MTLYSKSWQLSFWQGTTSPGDVQSVLSIWDPACLHSILEISWRPHQPDSTSPNQKTRFLYSIEYTSALRDRSRYFLELKSTQIAFLFFCVSILQDNSDKVLNFVVLNSFFNKRYFINLKEKFFNLYQSINSVMNKLNSNVLSPLDILKYFSILFFSIVITYIKHSLCGI